MQAISIIACVIFCECLPLLRDWEHTQDHSAKRRQCTSRYTHAHARARTHTHPRTHGPLNKEAHTDLQAALVVCHCFASAACLSRS